MLRPLLAALLIAAPATAAERTIGIGSFDRVRIDGAFDVRIATGKSPRASISGDQRALDQVDLRVEGTTLHLRRRGLDTTTARTAAGPVVVTLGAPTLASASMLGGGKLAVTGMRGERADLSVAGVGTISVDAVDVQRANVSIVGGGQIVLGGRARYARLSTNGPGSIDAAKLTVDDLTVRLDGPGETLANARYLAAVNATGLGRIVVTGNAKCTVRAPSADTVVCGAR
jgi:hypothetical protein